MTNHGVADDVLAAQFRVSAAFFALPAEEKLKLKVLYCRRQWLCNWHPPPPPPHPPTARARAPPDHAAGEMNPGGKGGWGGGVGAGGTG